jgi:hypothetical protein
MCDSTSSYATAGITLRVSEALKPHHHDKVETPLVIYIPSFINIDSAIQKLIVHKHKDTDSLEVT